jgi:predicted metal-dependent HD superfamily phosphohydrolase
MTRPLNPPDVSIRLAKSRFEKLAPSLGATPAQAERWLSTILNSYGESQRHYHTIDHVEAMLAAFEEHKGAVTEPEVVLLAIFFHDIVYDPRKHDNEDASMQLFKECARDLALPQPLTDSVLHLIDRTKAHDATDAEHPNLPLFLDFDLEVLSRTSEVYARYQVQIRQEYAHFPAPLFASTRAGILRRMLQRPSLYFSPQFQATHEAHARQNVEAEI